MGDPTPTPGGLCEGTWINGRVSEANVMVEASNDQGDTVGQVGEGSWRAPMETSGGVWGSSSGQGVK